MNIPQFNLAPLARQISVPNPGLFTRQIELRQLSSSTTSRTNNIEKLKSDRVVQTLCHFEYTSVRDVQHELNTSNYIAQALVLSFENMDTLNQGRWICILNETQGRTVWNIVGVQWRLGWNRYPLIKLERSTYAITGD